MPYERPATQPDESTQTPQGAPRGGLASSSGPVRTPSGRLDVLTERSAITRSYQRALAQDPLFSPLPELALARERVLEEDAESTTMVMRDRRLDRSVALKVMKGDNSEPRARRFLREALILGRLCHPSIPPVLDAGRATNGQPFMMSPVVSGPTFAEQLEAADAPGPIIALLIRVADALAHAHSMGIVHGSLGPSSVAGEWVTGWARGRDVSGKIPDLLDGGKPADEATDVKALAGLVQELSDAFEEDDLGEIAKKTHRDAASLADELRDLLAAPPPPVAGGGRTVLAILCVLLLLVAGAAGAGAAIFFKKSGALEKDLDKTRTDLKAREDAEAKRANSEKARALIQEAQSRARNGESDAVHKSVTDSLALERSELGLTLGGIALARVGDLAGARDLLKAATTETPPALAALVALHDLDGRPGVTESLREVRSRAKDSVEAEPYLAVVECIEAATERKDWAKALAAAERAVAAATRDPQTAQRLSYAWVCRATCRAATGDNDGALADWDRAIELDPRRARSWCERSAARRLKGQLDQAQADADRALAIEPKLARALVRRAQVQLDRNNDTATAAAIGDLSRAIEFESKDAEAWTLRGVARERKTDVDGALADFDRALDIDPRWVEALIGRGKARIHRQTDLAIKDLGRAIDIDNKSPAAFGARGDAYLAKAGEQARGSTEQAKSSLDLAIADLDKAIEYDSRNANHWELRGKARQQKVTLSSLSPAPPDYDSALGDYDRALELQPKNFEFWNNRGYLRLLRLEYGAAESDFSSAIGLEGRNPAPWNNRAFARLKKGALDDALADIEKALGLNARMAPAMKNKGLIKLAQGDPDAAIESFEKALVVDPNYRAAILGRADAKAAKGDTEGAIADYEKCLALQKVSPETQRITDKLAELKKAKEDGKPSPEDKKPDDKKPDDKKPEDKKPDDKKSDPDKPLDDKP